MIRGTCCSDAARHRAAAHSQKATTILSFSKKKVARKLQNNLERILPFAMEAFSGTFRMRFQPDLRSSPGKLTTSKILPVASSWESMLFDLRGHDSRWWAEKCCRQDSFSWDQHNSKRKPSLCSKQYNHGQVLKPATKHVLATESSYQKYFQSQKLKRALCWNETSTQITGFRSFYVFLTPL